MSGINVTSGRRSMRVKPQLESLDSRDVPTVIATNDFYFTQVGQQLTVGANKGVLSNDFSSTNFGAILVADLKTAPQINGTGPALPPNALTLSANGAFTFNVPSNFNTGNSPITFTYQARDTTNGDVAQATVTIVVNANNTKRFAVGAGEGGGPHVRVFDSSSGIQVNSFFPYESTFTGGVRVATGDINQDGVDDIVTAPGFGGSARISIFDGKTGAELGSFFAFEPTFTGGAYVAIGDVDGDLVQDVIVGAGEGGGPRVQVFDGINIASGKLNLPAIADFFAYESTFRGGVRVAAGDIDGDASVGTDEIVTGAGPDGGPAVKVFNATGIFSGIAQAPAVKSFFAFDSGNRGGVNVAVGQFRGDGKADIVAGTGNGSAVVRVFDGRSGAQLREFTLPNEETPTGGSGGTGGLFPPTSGSLLPPGLVPGSLVQGGTGSANRAGGARVAVSDRNGDGFSDIITGNGNGQISRVRVFDGLSLTELDNFLAFNGLFTGGVYVGGNS